MFHLMYEVPICISCNRIIIFLGFTFVTFLNGFVQNIRDNSYNRRRLDKVISVRIHVQYTRIHGVSLVKRCLYVSLGNHWIGSADIISALHLKTCVYSWSNDHFYRLNFFTNSVTYLWYNLSLSNIFLQDLLILYITKLSRLKVLWMCS